MQIKLFDNPVLRVFGTARRFQLFSCWFRVVDQADLRQLLSAR